MRITRCGCLSGVLLASFGLALPCAAQQEPPVRDKETAKDDAQREATRDILAGPKVNDESMAASTGFGMGDRQQREAPIPALQWFRVLQSLELTEEQAETVQSLRQRFEAAAAAYRREHAETLRDLERKIQAMRAGTLPPDRSIAQQLERLRAAAPNQERLQEAVWQVLTEDQQQTMRDRFVEIRQRQAERAAAAGRPADRAAMMESMRGGDERARREDAMRENTMNGEMMTPDRFGSAELEPARPGEMRGRGLDERGLRRLRFLRQFQVQPEQPGTIQPVRPAIIRERGAEAPETVREAVRDRLQQRVRERSAEE